MLHVSARSDDGGGPEHVRLLTKFATHFDHHVACPASGRYFDLFRAILSQDRVFDLSEPLAWPFEFWRLRAWCRAHDIRLVHSHGRAAGLLARPLALSLSIPSVHTFHGMHFDGTGLSERVFLNVERVLSRTSDSCIAVSDSEAQTAIRLKLSGRSQVHVVENGVEVEDWSRRVAVAPMKVAFVGRMEEVKDPLFLVDVVQQAFRRAELRNAIRFVIVGDGSMGERVRALLEVEERAGFVELRPESNVVDQVLRESHILLSTSKREGMPLVLLEALSRGLPVVVSAVPGNVDVVADPDAGVTYPMGSIDGALTQLALLADPAAWGKRSFRAWNYAHERFRAERMAARVESLYRKSLVT